MPRAAGERAGPVCAESRSGDFALACPGPTLFPPQSSLISDVLPKPHNSLRIQLRWLALEGLDYLRRESRDLVARASMGTSKGR